MSGLVHLHVLCTSVTNICVFMRSENSIKDNIHFQQLCLQLRFDELEITGVYGIPFLLQHPN